ncbi:MAG: alpha/beta hydrolase, partial [Sphingorhabdus sp.]
MKYIPLALSVPFLLAGCGIAVDYGKVRHSELSASPACNPASTDASAVQGKDFFMVTSRLPDCRDGTVRLTNHRSDAVRYARFQEPQTVTEGKGKKRIIVPTTFQPEADWWQALQGAADRRQGRVLLYVHGFRETIHSTSEDTTQIARLTGFDGPVIQYSWPSQGKLLSYAVDETNMYWDERNFRRFLQ